MSKKYICAVFCALCVSAPLVQADALGKDLGFVIDANGPRDASVEPGAKVAGKSSGKLLRIELPAVVVENPQCESGGQPCAEPAQTQQDGQPD